MTTRDDEGPVSTLTLEECWELLEGEEFGRLAYRLVDEVHLFRTDSGNKLLAAALSSDVAFEIDWHDDLAAWSVVARGRLRRLGEDEQHRADDLPLRPWVAASPKYEVLELLPDEVTGRAFRLQRGEPDHELVDR